MDLVSIIVPVYNAKDTLKNCIDSILIQCCPNFELLLIDDGSLDDSLSICESYALKDSRVRVFHKNNGGVSSARNVGLDSARGKWLTFIDSDDNVSLNFLSDLFNHEEDILFTGYIAKNSSSKILASKNHSELSESSSISDFINSFFSDTILRSPWAKFYKKELLRDLRFVEEMKIGEDAYFVLKYLSKCKNYGVLKDAEYIMNVGDELHKVKYNISIDYAAKSLSYMRDAFNDVVVSIRVKKGLFLSYINYYRYLSEGSLGFSRFSWYNNPIIKDVYKYVWPDLSLKQRVHILVDKFIHFW